MVLNKPLLPEPYRVCQTWYALMTTGVLWPHIASSLYRMEVRNYEEMYAAIPDPGRHRHHRLHGPRYSRTKTLPVEEVAVSC